MLTSKQMPSAFLALALAMPLLLPSAARAQEASLSVTLESLESEDQSCQGVFRVDNSLGRDIGFMTIEIAVQRKDDHPGRLFSLALMPSRATSVTRVAVPVLDSPCSVISDLLVNRVNTCRDRGGAPLDCDAPLKTASETEIPLTK